jgi:lysophospholipase L1-like esterase
MKNISPTVFAAMSIYLLVINSVVADVFIKDVDIKAQEGSVSVSSFRYTISGEEKVCAGNKFKIAPTESKEMKMDIMLQAPGYRDDIWVYMPNKLPVRNVVAFELVNKGGKILQEGVDYRLDKKGAVSQLKGAPQGGSIQTLATFSYFPDRYDSLFFDPVNGSFALVQGPVRNIDAEEYIPATPAGKIRFCTIAVTGDKVQVVTTYEKRTAVIEGSLTALQKKLKSGESIKVLGYGDSITAMGAGRTYEPNSKDNDRFEGYFSRFPNDTINAIEKYDFQDGVGKKHCKNGWNWKLIETIEKKYNNNVEYLNCGIGGTSSDATKNNGLFMDRIEVALAVKADLVVLAFGMNELGSSRTEKNIDEIIKKFKAMGADVIVMGVPQINGTRINDRNRWKETNDLLKKVALANNCPFIDTAEVNLGIAPEHICSANQYNHPGIFELNKYGEALAEVLK